MISVYIVQYNTYTVPVIWRLGTIQKPEPIHVCGDVAGAIGPEKMQIFIVRCVVEFMSL